MQFSNNENEIKVYVGEKREFLILNFPRFRFNGYTDEVLVNTERTPFTKDVSKNSIDFSWIGSICTKVWKNQIWFAKNDYKKR